MVFSWLLHKQVKVIILMHDCMLEKDPFTIMVSDVEYNLSCYGYGGDVR